MADNLQVTQGTGTTVAADEIAGVLHQRIKMVIGADGVNDGDVSLTNPMPTKSQVSGTGTITSIANSTSSGVALAANANRKGLIIHNDSTTTVFIAFAATSSNSAFTIRLTNQASYIYSAPIIYTGIISSIATATNGNLRITELT